MEDELLVLEDGKEVKQEQIGLLHKRVEELKLSNEALLAENVMFELFIGRLDPQDLLAQTSGEGQRTSGSSQLEAGGAGRRRRSRFNTSDRLQLLTLEQKLSVAQREVTEAQCEQEKLRLRYESVQDSHKASLEEAEVFLTEIRKMKSKCEHRVARPVKDRGREKTEIPQLSEVKIRVAQMRMFVLKNQGLKAQGRKLRKQLQHKKELDKAEEEIFMDYTKPTIPGDMDELKIKSLKAQRLLRSHQERLQHVAAECEELNTDIARRRQMLAKMEKDIQQAEEECLKEESLNERLQQHLTDYGQGPDTMEYFHAKEKHKKLQQSIHWWERKVGIAELALKMDPKVGSTQKVLDTPVNGAEAGAQSGQGHVPVNSHMEQNIKQSHQIA